MIMKHIAVFFFLALCFKPLIGQSGDYFLSIQHYPFIKYSENIISCPKEDDYLESFYQKLDSIMLMGKGQINIVHIGGSHIQADLYTHQTRMHLQSLQYDMNGGRGFIFPFKIAKTNNPWNYKVSYTGDWSFCKNIKIKSGCKLGLSGYSVTTQDNSATINISLNSDSTTSYYYTRLKVFHEKTDYKIGVQYRDSIYSGIYDSIAGYSFFILPKTSTLDLVINKPENSNSEFTLYGLSFETDDPGIVYHSIGVNGARLSSYLNCDLYKKHIAALHPDLVIFSIGTNDGNTKYFDKIKYHSEYFNLIQETLEACPNAKIMITVPNDAYYYKRYVNKNTIQIQDAIYSLAKENNYAVWDFFNIMGGLNSSQTWYDYGIMKYDRIHFNLKGYLIKGDLFTTALLKGWEQNLEKRIASYSITRPPSTASTNTNKDY